MTKRKWIGLVGRAGVGKDYTYTQMYRIDPQAVRIAFADGVRLDVEAVLGRSLKVLWEKPYPDEIRRLLQWWGTDLRRAQSPDHWVMVGEKRAALLHGTGSYPVFTDVRFQNEADLIRKHSGILVRVVASNDVRKRRLGELPPDHASEFESDDIICDYQIVSEAHNGGYARMIQSILTASGFNGYDTGDRVAEEAALRGPEVTD